MMWPTIDKAIEKVCRALVYGAAYGSCNGPSADAKGAHEWATTAVHNWEVSERVKRRENADA
jgi:hypothetical protein